MSAKLEIVGFVANEPSRGSTQAGKSWLSISVAHTPRTLNKQSNQYEDVKGRNGEDLTVWVRATFFEDMADYLGTVLSKGTMVRVEGEPRMNAYLDKSGSARGGIDLWNASLTLVPRPQKRVQGASSGAGVGGSSSGAGFGPQNADSGWATDPNAPF